MPLSNSLSLPLKPVAFSVAILFLLAEVFVPALQFRQTCRGCSPDRTPSSPRSAGLRRPRRRDRRDGAVAGRAPRQGGNARPRAPARRQHRSHGADAPPAVAIVSLALTRRARASSSALSSRLAQFGRCVTLCFRRPRCNKTLVQEARGRFRRQVRSGRRAAVNERVGFGFEIVHVSLDAGDATHPVAVVFAVVGRLVPNLQGRLGGFDRRVSFKTDSGDGDDPTTTPVLHERRRHRRLRLSLPPDAGAIRQSASRGRAISPRRA